jgi:hypothetical protein
MDGPAKDKGAIINNTHDSRHYIPVNTKQDSFSDTMNNENTKDDCISDTPNDGNTKQDSVSDTLNNGNTKQDSVSDTPNNGCINNNKGVVYHDMIINDKEHTSEQASPRSMHHIKSEKDNKISAIGVDNNDESQEMTKSRAFSIISATDAFMDGGSNFALNQMKEIPSHHEAEETTNTPRWESKGSWLILGNLIICNVLLATVAIGFGIYYMEFVTYFDVSKGTISIMQSVNKFIGIPAGDVI